MTRYFLTRPTIYQAQSGLPLREYKNAVPDQASRRFLAFAMDFDTRAVTLGIKIDEAWEPHIKEMWRKNQQGIRDGLVRQFGEHHLEYKIKNFIAMDSKPMSIVAYHNAFFDQVRKAFTIGSYYPALVGACALGERILNHLILDLRDHYVGTPEYKRVYRKLSFDDWDTPIRALEAWEVLLADVAQEFRALKLLRHRSIHFNMGTYSTLREDALQALLHMRTIIDGQFGTFGVRPWFIEGTKGHMFIRKEFEENPFIASYFIPRCAYVGPLFGMARDPTDGLVAVDVPDYGDGTLSDAEFAIAYNERSPEQVVTEMPEMEWADGQDSTSD